LWDKLGLVGASGGWSGLVGASRGLVCGGLSGLVEGRRTLSLARQGLLGLVRALRASSGLNGTNQGSSGLVGGMSGIVGASRGSSGLIRSRPALLGLVGAHQGLSELVGGLSGLVGAYRGSAGIFLGLEGLDGAWRGLSWLVVAHWGSPGLVRVCRGFLGLVGLCWYSRYTLHKDLRDFKVTPVPPRHVKVDISSIRNSWYSDIDNLRRRA